MRKIILIALVLTLAACGGNGGDDNENPPTATDSPNLDVRPTEALSEEEIEAGLTPRELESFAENLENQLNAQQSAVPFPTQTPASEGALPIPLPGTLVSSETEEPEPIGDFTAIFFEQRGGVDATVLTIQISGDGRVSFNGGAEVPADPALIAELNRMIEDINFFGLQGTFMGPPANDDIYRYRVAITAGEYERAINAQDGFIPDQFAQLLGLIRQIGDAAALSSGSEFNAAPAGTTSTP